MEKEFNLSDNIMFVFGNDKSKENMIEMISLEDVKEFIKRLKDRFLFHKECISEDIDIDSVILEIDKLAGEKLIVK